MSIPLVGFIAVGTVFVEGPSGTAQAFTEAERSAVELSVIRGEQLLCRLSQAFSPNRFLQCSFFNESRSVVINPGPIPAPTNTEGDRPRRDREITAIERHWLDLALRALGFPSSPSLAPGVFRYQSELRQKNWRVTQKPREAAVIIVTKFNTGYSAYVGDSGQVCLQFDWLCDTSGNFRGTGVSGFGIESLDRTVAHELGHVFGGLDEYEPCSANQTSGPRPTNNMNCVRHGPCLMNHNTNTLCPETVEHFGWLDLDGDGVVDAALPVVDAIGPNSGTAGTTITMSGAGLGEARSVVFVGVGAADFTIVSDKELRVIVPLGSGEVDVFVSTPFGITLPSSVLRFIYV
jgi:hypothetical protein